MGQCAGAMRFEHTSPSAKRQESRPPARTAIAIVGAGILGSSSAAYLAAAGAAVVVFDEVGVAGGASGRNSGAIEHPYDAAQREVYERSLRLMRALGVGIPEHPRGVLLIDRDPSVAVALVDQMRLAHPELLARLVEPAELATLEPTVASGHWACRVETGFPVPPRVVTELYIQEARRHGARVHTGLPAGLLWEGATCIGLSVGERRVLADHVIVAAGSATCKVVDPTGQWVPVSASWGVNIGLDVFPQPQHVLLEAGVVRAQMGNAPHVEHAFSLIPGPDQSWLGSTFLRAEPRPDAWESRLLQHGADFVPRVRDSRVLTRLACARPRSIDGRPLLGHVSGVKNLSVATGNGGRGISTGADSGRLVAEAVITGSSEQIPHALRANRFPFHSTVWAPTLP